MALRAIVLSFGVHAGLAVGLVAGGSGHVAPGAPASTPIEVVDIDTAAETVPPPAPLPAKVEETLPTAAKAPPPTHTHRYPVPPDHDAHPHDPSLPHDHAEAHDPAEAPAAEAPAVATAPAAAAMPVFSMSSGRGTLAPGATRVAADARGDGTGAGVSAGATTHGDDQTYSVSAVSAPAKLVAGVTAAYPPAARADDVEGDVGLEIVVDARGSVVDARVVARAGHGFDDAALAAIRRYRFSPASREGRSVRVRMPWTVQFRLR